MTINNMKECITSIKAIEEWIYPSRLQQYRKMLVKLSKVFIVISIGVKKKTSEQIQPTYLRDIYILANINHCIPKEYIFQKIAFIFIIINKRNLKNNWTSFPNKNKTFFPNMKDSN